MEAEVREKSNDDHKDKKLKVEVYAPRSAKPKKFNWDADLLVSAAAAEAAEKFGYSGGTPGLSKNDTVLDPNQTLRQAGVKDGDVLELIDKGGGV